MLTNIQDSELSSLVAGDRCGVCSYSFEEGDEVKQLACGHELHAGCANTFLYVKAECPTCGIALARGKARRLQVP